MKQVWQSRLLKLILRLVQVRESNGIARYYTYISPSTTSSVGRDDSFFAAENLDIIKLRDFIR